MRNTEKDAAKMAERRESILDAGFRLFAEKTIDPVSMNDVAKAAGVGIVTPVNNNAFFYCVLRRIDSEECFFYGMI